MHKIRPFEPKDPAWEAKVRASYARQGVMGFRKDVRRDRGHGSLHWGFSDWPAIATNLMPDPRSHALATQ